MLPTIRFWSWWSICKLLEYLLNTNTQATYLSERTKKVYEALVGEVLSVEDAPTDQKDISKIATLAKLVVLSIKYIHKLNHRATDIAYSIVAIIKKTHNYGND